MNGRAEVTYLETGLGAGPQTFKNFSLHTFPSTLKANRLFLLDFPLFWKVGSHSFNIAFAPGIMVSVLAPPPKPL